MELVEEDLQGELEETYPFVYLSLKPGLCGNCHDVHKLIYMHTGETDKLGALDMLLHAAQQLEESLTDEEREEWEAFQ